MFGATPLSLEWVAWAPAKMGDYHPIELPRTMRDAIAQRIARLPQGLRDVLDTVAVAGQGVRPELLAAVQEIPRVRAAGMAAPLVKRQLLMEEGVFRCAHRVIQDVVREDLTPASRLELHRALALGLEALTPSETGDEVAGGIASHADQGGEPALAHRYALRASEAAARRYAFEEALAWLDPGGGYRASRHGARRGESQGRLAPSDRRMGAPAASGQAAGNAGVGDTAGGSESAGIGVVAPGIRVGPGGERCRGSCALLRPRLAHEARQRAAQSPVPN